MRSLIIALSCLCVLVSACGGGSGSESGPLVDNSLWEITDEGEEFFGTPPPDSECPPPSETCPVPGEEFCPDLAIDCVAGYTPECLTGIEVLAVYSEVCPWVTLKQNTLIDIKEGDQVEVRIFHFLLTAPRDSVAQVRVVIGDVLALEEDILIPASGGGRDNGEWFAPKDIPAGSPIYYHVNNHGRNEYALVEINVL